MAHHSQGRSPGDFGHAIPSEGADGASGAPERLFPRTPVPRRTLVVSASLAAVGLVAFIVAAVVAVSHMGPSEQPLEVTPLGLDGPAPPAGGSPPVAPQPAGKVPDVVGMSFARASSLLERAGFRAQARYEQASQPRDTVISQDPEPGSPLARRGTVILAVSAGLLDDPSIPATPTTVADGNGNTATTRRPAGTTRRPPSTTEPAPGTTKPPETTATPETTGATTPEPTAPTG
jgi:PASTA domain